MSTWGNGYNPNRNQNYFQQNSFASYQQVDGSRPGEILNNFGTTANSENVSYSVQQNPMTFIPNGSGSSGRQHSSSFYGAEFYQPQPEVNGAQVPAYSVELTSDVWARAANSELTPTAGEFIPSSSYQNSNAFQPSVLPQESKNSQRGLKGEFSTQSTASRPNNAHNAVRNSAQDSTSYSQRKSNDKPKTKNPNNQRQQNIEQSKAEGRKKLLQEAAAGLNPQREQGSGPSRVSNSISNANAYDRRRARSGRDTSQSYTSASYSNNDNSTRGSFKLQDGFHHSQNKSPRKTNAGVSHSKDHIKGADDCTSQRDRLTKQLNRGTLECLVCCELVRQTDHVWSCLNCFHVLHLRCIVKWANTSKADNGWRCPACQNVTVTTPCDYYCFCGKMRSPEWTRTDTAHSCGEVCDRPKVLASEHYSCAHRCTLLCHPGPCPPCVALVIRKCGCGKSNQSVQCGQVQPLVCSEVCNKPLGCGVHCCTDKCHLGNCQPCPVVIKQVCFCGKETRELQCDGEVVGGEQFECGAVCEGELSCEQHRCERSCHEGPCGVCPRDPSVVTHCHCGQTVLATEQPRHTCLDPVPCCGRPCSKQLTCGQPSAPHRCEALCHGGACPPCDKVTLVRCRCGYMDREIPCVELTTKADDARCQKKCTKKRLCGKHKCNQLCCIDVDHVCPMACNHMLSCGQHRCEQLCHRGHCQPCLRSSFEELYCECGASVLMPPVPCGTKPPPCDRPCTRTHQCDHEVLHNCHSYPVCPPCSVLTAKYCHGKHELRKAVACHVKEFSCGLPCGGALPCGRHKCIQPCHAGDCSSQCKQPCTSLRDLCGHRCNAVCHDGICPDTPCKENVVVTCECGHRSMSRPCFENNSEYQRIATSLLASKMADVQLGRSVHLNTLQRKITIKTLECTEECRVIERNRRLAIGLQIRNPDLTSKLTPRYSDFMRVWSKKDPRFCQNIHDKLTELVKLAKESKQKSRSYSFETMNREKRQFVHEYCTHFGCESVAYDAEPKRNVVATAQRDKAWLPSYSLLEVVQREMGLRKVPPPTINSSTQKTTNQSNVLPVRVALSHSAKPTPTPTATTDTHAIDYFDYNG